jgi:hypothetical protein
VNVNAPFFAGSPIVIAPFNVKAFESDRGAVVSLDSTPPVMDNEPVPNAPSLATMTFPALIVTPAVKPFEPLRVNDPEPAFTRRPPTPETTPLSVTGPAPLIVTMFDCKSKGPLNVTGLFEAAADKVDVPDTNPAPLNVKAPVFVALPSVTVPFNV